MAPAGRQGYPRDFKFQAVSAIFFIINSEKQQAAVVLQRTLRTSYFSKTNKPQQLTQSQAYGTRRRLRRVAILSTFATAKIWKKDECVEENNEVAMSGDLAQKGGGERAEATTSKKTARLIVSQSTYSFSDFRLLCSRERYSVVRPKGSKYTRCHLNNV